jgi:uncharacterized protein YbjQ (UPF0145 family)
LPSSAHRRLEAAAAGAVGSSLESVGGTAGLRLAGFDPVTEVMGCTVSHLGWFGCRCGYEVLGGPVGNVRTLVSGVYKGGYAPYAKAVQAAWDSALSRLLEEAVAVGADGVVGIRPTRRRVTGTAGTAGNEEFVLLGTAVRARGDVRPQRPFTADLGGDRFAALVRGGWIPTGYAITVAVGVRHEDWQTRRVGRVFAPNQEMVGFTELVHDTRRATRDQFARTMARFGSETAVVSDLRMRMWEVRGGNDHTDHLCEVTIEGTGVVAYERAAGDRHAPPALTVLPLTDRRRLPGPQHPPDPH